MAIDMKLLVVFLLLSFLDLNESIRQFRDENQIDSAKSIIILYHNYSACSKCYIAPASMLKMIEENSEICDYEVIIAINAKTVKQFNQYRKIYGWDGKLIYDDIRFRSKLEMNSNIVLVVINNNNKINFMATDIECTEQYSLTFQKLLSALKIKSSKN
jgi:hypothetical protein